VPAAFALVALSALAAQAVGAGGRILTGSRAAHGATILRYELHSRLVGLTLAQVAAIPPGGSAGRPLLVFLHGRGADGQESNANDAFFAALAALGSRAPDVVFPSGGEASYWHARASGDWSGYVLREVIPQAIARLHADPSRIAIGGISMGGYGAYEVARLRPSEFCAVGGDSAALWLSAGESAPGAFGDAADFTRHDVIAPARRQGRRPWGRAALWLDGGDADPFHEADLAFARALGIPLHIWPGGHDARYWAAHYRDYLRFYAQALAACRRSPPSPTVHPIRMTRQPGRRREWPGSAPTGAGHRPRGDAMPSIAFAAPILPGKTEADREAIRSCADGERRAEFEASRGRHGIKREAVWIQPTPGGDVAVVYIEADDLEAAFAGIGSSEDPFDRWFREQVRDVHGIDLAEPFPPPEQILDFQR
jgi:fermentation-respiration switch protein FrsA (DUF1100 family)